MGIKNGKVACSSNIKEKYRKYGFQRSALKMP